MPACGQIQQASANLLITSPARLLQGLLGTLPIAHEALLHGQ
jgi:hypothetical protein